MLKKEMIKNVAEKGKISQKTVDTVLYAFAEVLVETLTDDTSEKIPLPGVGTFTAREVKEKTGEVRFGEHKGEVWVKPAHREIKFSITQPLKDL